MLIAKGEEGQEDRVLWIDFDSAWTNLPDDDEHREWFEDEKEFLQQFADDLVRAEHDRLSESFCPTLLTFSRHKITKKEKN